MRFYGHSTTYQAPAVAEATQPKTAALPHIDLRLNPTIYQDVAKIGTEAIVAEDNTVIKI